MADFESAAVFHVRDMKTWTKSAMRNYYLDPAILFVEIGRRDDERPASVHPGYYVKPHCDPDCCQAIGNIPKADFGPFSTAVAARKWSARNLAAVD
jgi:hypothetical protein